MTESVFPCAQALVVEMGDTYRLGSVGVAGRVCLDQGWLSRATAEFLVRELQVPVQAEVIGRPVLPHK